MAQSLPLDTRTAQKLDTRARLLRVAAQLFDADGVDAVTVDQIARTAETSRANFYLHFSGKADLLHAMRRDMWKVAQGFYDAFALLPDTHPRTLLGWLQGFADAWASHAEQTRAILVATPREVSAEYVEHLQDFIAALTRDPRKWPRLAPDEARRRAHLLISQLSGFLSELHVHGMPMDRAAMLTSFSTLWSKALSAPEPRPD
jgi:AcrR family transcriptional regulator